MARKTTIETAQIWQAVAVERTSLVELLRSLPENGWEQPSLCAGWRVRDVVAHLILSADSGVGAILFNLIRARGDFDRMVRDTAIRHADRRTTAQLLAELHDSIGARVTPVGTTPVDRLMDLLVHGQDIAIPLGIPREMPVAAAELALDRIWNGGFPFHARKKFGDYHLVASDSEWTAGTGPVIEGSVTTLLLLVTGRRPAPDQLTGEGAAQLLAERAGDSSP
ncbi:maleylpyruvate isomerase family mycothiol-dependent enzyme [Nocardia cerradoensis]|uniref:maleylpyruvate isomerase family mycothiol-dependent enzyme n=1 Tax=Nocardia cerradoensis TaxID=85688 RepID=UPI000302DD69|nr:maleylpyruvate isomerase family mycothiol-dependent enzyme [Nocardia cerradoensis]NKY44523.1 maleylpyruvate isomerase family mycothiol-dependent enzyme [Nocardia cerradoensis]